MINSEDMKEKRQNAEELTKSIISLSDKKKLILLGISIGLGDISTVLNSPPENRSA